tara:strand:+ start:4690 stop:6144 length:1455 start_codon:yes stop_codon:yes gene_type:complete
MSSEICDYSSSFFNSSITLENEFQDFDSFLKWFFKRKTSQSFTVNEIPFNKLDQWSFTDDNKDLAHESGKFFKIKGISVETNFGIKNKWEQPIIDQPEIGILGILTKVFNGVRYFLMQAKMEPGNVNILQLSPTVQATKSNFSQVHKGKLPSYLEYFISEKKSKFLYDQLQTEQGGRFLKKRNRNIVIEVNEDIKVLPDFCWLTLGEIKKLLTIDNFVNMDARSVISVIPLVDDHLVPVLNKLDFKNIKPSSYFNISLTKLNYDLINSIISKNNSYKTMDQLISWYTSQKVDYELITKIIPLKNLKDWEISENSISSGDRHFTVIGVDVIAGNREVTKWTQPLLKDNKIGLLGILVKKINGIFHFLIQAKVEPGHIDLIELSPTVSCSNISYLEKNKSILPKFYKFFKNANKENILYNTIQSEEGGRFFQLQNQNMIVIINDDKISLPKNYTWMTLNQITHFMKYSKFNIEARSLISSLNFLFK